ncbi:class II aldolase/adducin-like protein [Caballeronia glebae]|uniref:Class II aldolase/adducin-like protein n=1 Tax=Caballeronia glebae TaxID=1777143 RepID=A0A158AUU4_9BURK|nr:class II aldolase/adducin family protein [Caballeronia glebae]SAK61708.1 class II aldolase/adducin-like protein [Caballeronia glebae]
MTQNTPYTAAPTTHDAHDMTRLFDDLAAANHILAQHEVLDGFGHVSVRDPRNPQHFLIAQSMAPELVQPDDILTLDFDCQPVDGDTRKRYLETWIHAEIYRARPDVKAVVHSHSPSVIPFAASSVQLRPIYHMAGFLATGSPVFDIRHCFGCTDMLVRNSAQGKALAETLGNSDVALMRGHGFVATGPSLPAAVYRAIYTELNAAMQQKAIALGGEVTYLDEGEGRASTETNLGVIERPWTLWKRQVETLRRD